MLIKSQLGQDKRRFRLKEQSFPCLCYNISSLYCLSNDYIYTLAYLDDENEWVTLSSTEDLKEAFSISPKIIKVLVNKVDDNSNHQDYNNKINYQQQQQNKTTMMEGNRIENIALQILTNTNLMANINNIVSQSLATHLTDIISNTVPYAIPLLVSSISTLKKENTNSDQQPPTSTKNNIETVELKSTTTIPSNESIPISSLFLQPPLTIKEKRFSCSAEEKYLKDEPLPNKSTSMIGQSLNNMPPSNLSALSQSLPSFTHLQLPPPPSATSDMILGPSSFLKESKEDMMAPTPSSRKTSSPLPYLFGRNNEIELQQQQFRPISPANELSESGNNVVKKRTLKTFFSSILSSSPSPATVVAVPPQEEPKSTPPQPPQPSASLPIPVNSQQSSSSSTSSPSSSPDHTNVNLNLNNTFNQTIEQFS